MKYFLAFFLLICPCISAIEKLRIYNEATPEAIFHETSDFVEITEILSSIGVQFEKWNVSEPLSSRPTEDEIFDAYNNDILRIMTLNDYRTVDVIRMFPEAANKTELRNKFLREHTHEEDEVRLFVEGEGLFYLHIEDKVYIVLCEKGELISIPAHYRHWFDMGEYPYFIALRFFIEPSGWIAQFTGSEIASLFPRHETKQIEAVVLDIEGTTTAISFVHDILFPYARERIASYIDEHRGESKIAALIEDIRDLAHSGSEDIAEILLDWMRHDFKYTPLKTLQGLIWEEGYLCGRIKAHIYDDVAEQLQLWKDSGRKLYIFSSGSIHAQQLLFAHTAYGDLTSLFSGYFDTHIGRKKDKDAYQNIADSIGLPPSRILFLSDSPDEVDAALDAGFQALIVSREGEDPATALAPIIHNFHEVILP